ncbi:7813_t:CDS:1, partial [Funneliformis geosporum]
STGVTTLKLSDFSTDSIHFTVKVRVFTNILICAARLQNYYLTKSSKDSSGLSCMEPPALVSFLILLPSVGQLI